VGVEGDGDPRQTRVAEAATTGAQRLRGRLRRVEQQQGESVGAGAAADSGGEVARRFAEGTAVPWMPDPVADFTAWVSTRLVPDRAAVPLYVQPLGPGGGTAYEFAVMATSRTVWMSVFPPVPPVKASSAVGLSEDTVVFRSCVPSIETVSVVPETDTATA